MPDLKKNTLHFFATSQSDRHGQRTHFRDGHSSQPHRTARTVLPNVPGSWSDVISHWALYHEAGVQVFSSGILFVWLYSTGKIVQFQPLRQLKAPRGHRQ